MEIYDMESKKYVDFDKVITTYKTFGHLNLHNALEAFNEIPAADVQPVVRGKWIVKERQALFPGMDEHPVFACSECGYQIYDLLDNVKERHHYCTNCGADMRGTNE